MGDRNIGKRIAQYRELSGYTQESFAEKIGVSTSYLSAVERGAKFPRLDNLIAIMNGLDCTADDIFVDVLNRSHSIKASWLSEEVDGLPESAKKRIFAVVEVLVHDAKNE